MDEGGHGSVDEQLFSLRLSDWQDWVNETSHKQEVKWASLNSFYHSRERNISLRHGSFYVIPSEFEDPWRKLIPYLGWTSFDT